MIRKSGLEIKNRCTQEGLNGEILASIRKSGPEIKNRCTQEGLNREKLASIPKSRPEIKNRCTQDGLNGENRAGHPPARVYKRGSAGGKSEVFCVKVGSTVAAKRVLMRPEAAFPYVFAAEGAQHPPKKPPRSTVSRNGCRRNKLPRPTTLAAAFAYIPHHPPTALQHKKRG